MIFGKPFSKKWYLRLCVCVLCLTLLAWYLKITQNSQQTSKVIFQKRERKLVTKQHFCLQCLHLCSNVCNKSAQWLKSSYLWNSKKKKIHYLSSSKWKGSQCLDKALSGFQKVWKIQYTLDLRKPDLRKNLDLRKMVGATGFLVHKLFDLRKIF